MTLRVDRLVRLHAQHRIHAPEEPIMLMTDEPRPRMTIESWG
jgi:hypothetical protein